MAAYYNEIEPYAAQWLRNLIAAGHIAPGDVDERSIIDVQPNDLRGYTQCHFFAGIGGWSYALRLAGWPDDRPVWTGSCPCQPFSAAGKQEGVDDPRHLWPDWFRLVREHRPHTIFGEQVSAAIRHGWLDLVSTDLEDLDYAVGSAVMGAHSVGAPHIRQRLYWVADRNGSRCGTGRPSEAGDGRGQARLESSGLRVAGELAHCIGERHTLLQRESGNGLDRRQDRKRPQFRSEPCGSVSELGDPNDTRSQGRRMPKATGERLSSGELTARETGNSFCVDHTAGPRFISEREGSESEARDEARLCGPERRRGESFWSDCIWLPCIDGKARPAQSGIFPLAHGATARVGRLRAFGNAIVPQVAAEFIKAYMSVRP